MKVKLGKSHTSFVPGAEGSPGDVVDVKAELAARWIKDGSAERCDGEPDAEVQLFEEVDAAKPKPKPKRKATSDAAAAAETREE